VLKVTFSGPSAGAHFVAADLLPELSSGIEEAVLDLLLRSAVRSGRA
jgi:hypothetical protein